MHHIICAGLIGLMAASCVSAPPRFRDAQPRAQEFAAAAHASGDPVLAGYADKLLEHRDDDATRNAALCLASLLEGMTAETALTQATGDKVQPATERLATSAKLCVSKCNGFRSDSNIQRQADAFEYQLVEDVLNRCETRWGARLEKVHGLTLRSRLGTFDELGTQHAFVALWKELAKMDKDIAELQRSGGLQPEAIRELTTAVAAVRTKYASGLARVDAYERDPKVIAAKERLDLLEQEFPMLQDAVTNDLNCEPSAEDPSRCDSANIRLPYERTRLKKNAEEQRKIKMFLEKRQVAAGLK